MKNPNEIKFPEHRGQARFSVKKVASAKRKQGVITEREIDWAGTPEPYPGAPPWE